MNFEWHKSNHHRCSFSLISQSFAFAKFILIKCWKRPHPITFIKAFKHYILLELEWIIEIYPNNSFILFPRKKLSNIGWLSSHSVISWPSGITSFNSSHHWRTVLGHQSVLDWCSSHRLGDVTLLCTCSFQHYAFLSGTACFGPGKISIHCCPWFFLRYFHKATLEYLCSFMFWFLLILPMGINCHRIVLV